MQCVVFVCSGNIRYVSSIHLRLYRTVFCCVAEILRTVQSLSEVRMDKKRKERMNVFRESSDCDQSVESVGRESKIFD